MAEKKVSVVTGGASGIGYAITEMLLKQNHIVSVFDIDPDSLNDIFPDFVKNGHLNLFKLDIRDENAVKNAYEVIKRTHRKLDILVNNAGILSTKSIVDEELKEWERIIDVNLTGVFVCCKGAISIMTKQKAGCIVNISSISGLKQSIFSSPSYCASKAGIIGFSRCIAAQLAEYNIRVNCIAPSSTETPMLDAVDKDVKESYRKSIPLNRMAIPQDIANAVDFLTSEKASYITGETINVNGGLLMP